MDWRGRSIPYQGPRHQDGYQVFIIRGGGQNPLSVILTRWPTFEMKRMDVSNGSPDTNIIVSILRKDFGFTPGMNNANYILKEADSTVFVD